MDESNFAELEEGLTAVMHRFRESFLGEGINLSEERVSLRERKDFGTPLVTVLGHTYGLRLVPGGERPQQERNGSAVEASVNVYDDEFELERFKSDLAATYEWNTVSRIIENFATPDDEAAIGNDVRILTSLFSFDVDTDVDVFEKDKTKKSVVTGRLVDTVLRVRYVLEDSERLRDRALFVSAVYLYCLRPFAAAYRTSLTRSRS